MGISATEGEGFEPSIRFNPYSGLANRRTRPLCDPSATKTGFQRIYDEIICFCTPNQPELSKIRLCAENFDYGREMVSIADGNVVKKTVGYLPLSSNSPLVIRTVELKKGATANANNTTSATSPTAIRIPEWSADCPL